MLQSELTNVLPEYVRKEEKKAPHFTLTPQSEHKSNLPDFFHKSLLLYPLSLQRSERVEQRSDVKKRNRGQIESDESSQAGSPSDLFFSFSFLLQCIVFVHAHHSASHLYMLYVPSVKQDGAGDRRTSHPVHLCWAT